MNYKLMGIFFIIIMLLIAAYCIYAIFFTPLEKKKQANNQANKQPNSFKSTMDSSEALSERLLSKIEHYEDYVPPCKYHMDSGYVCAPTSSDTNYDILPLQMNPPNIQKQVAKDIKNEWSEEYDGYSIDEIINGWSDTNVLFVLIDKRTKSYIGCVGVDRKNFYPYISHLYIRKTKRNRGYSKKLLKFAEEYVSKFGFDEARLWCDTNLVPYYEKMGWRIEDITSKNMTKVYIMTKILV